MKDSVATASVYVLNVRPERRETLLNAEPGWFGGPRASEPVPAFGHSRRAPLVVLAAFEDGHLTHVGEARKGASAGTGLVRLNMISLEALTRPIPFEEVIGRVPAKFKPGLRKALSISGLLPPKTMSAVVDVLSEMDPVLQEKLSRMSASRRELMAALGDREKKNLALQKETLGAALEIAGVGTQGILEWTPGTVERASFLDGLGAARVREDVMLHADLASLPGFNAISEAPHIAVRTFQSETDSAVRVTVVMANRLPLEQQTGADLIYFNETYRSFILVQYKALEKVDNEHEFRWTDEDQFSGEIARMDKLLEELDKIEPDTDPDAFRLSSNPFFLKFCSRIVFNPDDRGLFPGMYLPLGLWKSLAQSGRLKGARGGNLLTYNNVGRKLSGTEFITLVAGSWVGTTITQSASLETMIRSVLESGRTVTFAVKRSTPPAPAVAAEVFPELDEGEALTPEEALVEITK
ncbi:hypothetical protein [Rhodopseudomonas sp. BR0G17]|uniref:hypothetical protein n=1 Tax=Rhodopseudomonas sp. BR0G17 TaxID=2269368 RepID=UPI0013E0D32A|nr:hypothetical protein [Rhodopseudomonas sp. BR0G17]NEW98073.1 hypothetical protein [Rhodopseudomonas sp. BR0G17]